MNPSTLDLPWPQAWRKRRWGMVIGAAVVAFVLACVAFAAFLYGRVVGSGGFSVLAVGILAVGVAVVVGAVILSKLKTPEAAVEPVLIEVDGAATPGVRFPVKPPALAAARGASDRDDLGIDLTPEHLVISLGDAREVMPWSDIAKVDATSHSRLADKRSSRVQNWIRIVGHEGGVDRAGSGVKAAVKGLRWALGEDDLGKVKAEIVHTRLATDPLLVYHTLRFYLANPDRRDELADARATARLREGRVAG